MLDNYSRPKVQVQKRTQPPVHCENVLSWTVFKMTSWRKTEYNTKYLEEEKRPKMKPFKALIPRYIWFHKTAL